MAQPGDADALAEREARRTGAEGVDHADDLVAGHDAAAARREVALGEVEVGATDAADGHAHADLARARFGNGSHGRDEGMAVDGTGRCHLPGVHAGQGTVGPCSSTRSM